VIVSIITYKARGSGRISAVRFFDRNGQPPRPKYRLFPGPIVNNGKRPSLHREAIGLTGARLTTTGTNL
jgi:hypothetical protein